MASKSILTGFVVFLGVQCLKRKVRVFCVIDNIPLWFFVEKEFKSKMDEQPCTSKSAKRKLNFNEPVVEKHRYTQLLNDLENESEDGTKVLGSIQYLLIEKKANPNYVFRDLGVSPLHVAAGIGDEWFSLQVLRTCMACGGDPNIRSSDGLTPVHVAAIWKRMGVLKLLTEFGGDIFIADDDGFSSLDYIKKADDLINLTTSQHQGSVLTDNGVEKSSLIHVTSVGAPIYVTQTNATNSFESYCCCDCQTEDGRIDIFNNAFIEDDGCFHSCSSRMNNLHLSDVPSDLCYSEIHSSLVNQVFNKFDSPLVDHQYHPLKSIDRDISIYYPSHLHYHSKTDGGVTFGVQLAEIWQNESIRMATTPRFSFDTSIYYEAVDFHPESSCGSLSSCPTEKLKRLLQENEIVHGPLVKSTKRVYLYQLRKVSNGLKERSPKHQPLEFNDVVISTLNGKITDCVDKWSPLELLMIEQFEALDKHELKLDSSKQYFTYLLLDPIISQGIEKSTSQECLNRSWPNFLKSVFYIGKGKNSRPLDHLIDAVKCNKSFVSDKIRKIKTIWEKGFGVVCIHIFHNISEAEALTREACMISALSIARLTNVQNGKCYGGIQKLSLKKRRQLGVVLLYRSMLLLMAEGERQIFSADLRK